MAAIDASSRVETGMCAGAYFFPLVATSFREL